MQAITVRFLSPTHFRGGRYIAEAQAGRLILSEGYGKSPEENAIRAAKAFAERYGWNYGKWIGGQTKDGCWAFACDSFSSLSFMIG